MSESFLIVAAGAGALALLTPCVFPMIPLTAAYFSDPSQTPAERQRLALTFGAGIVASFTGLGILAATTFGAAGLARFAANPWVNLAFAFLFLFFAAVLLEIVRFPVPGRLVNRLDQITRARDGRKPAGALLLGAVFTVTSFTCTAPFVGSLLVLASRGEWTRPLLGMFIFSVVFALPFYFLALAPSLVARLPKSGDWMTLVRASVAAIEVAAAIKFASNADAVLGWGILTRTGVLVAWGGVAILLGSWLVWQLVARAGSFARPRIALAAISFIIASFAIAGATGRSAGTFEAFLPPPVQAQAPPNATATPVILREGNLDWILNDYGAAIAIARASGKQVFVDFTGFTCTNCRWMELNVFSRPEISAELSRFVLSRLFTDGDGPVYEKQQRFQEEKFSTVALPLYAIVNPDGSTHATLAGVTRRPAAFLAFLRGPGAENHTVAAY